MAAPGQPPSLTVSTLSSFKEKFPQLNVSLVPSSSTPVQPQPAAGVAPSSTSPPPACQAANIATLAEMFPLMTEAALQRALSQCGGHLSSALDLLLTQDLVDSERHQQSLYTTRFRPICDLWVRGQCCGARAAACRGRHFYNDTDACRRSFTRSKKKEKRKLEEGFSSPYRARIVREQVEVVKEQVNVDSGDYEKWSEVQERELVDLTGSNAEEIIDLSSDDDESCDKFKVEMESIKRGTEYLEEDVPVECKGDMMARMLPGIKKLAKRKLRFGSENEQSEVLIESLIVQMENIKDIIDQTALAIENTADLSFKKRGKRSENNQLEGNPKRMKIELPKTNQGDVENPQEFKMVKKTNPQEVKKVKKKKTNPQEVKKVKKMKTNPQEVKKLKKKTKRNKVALSSDQQKTKDSVKSEQCMSKTSESALVNSKRRKQKKKSKRNKGDMKKSQVGKKPYDPVKSEKCSKSSKSNVVKSGNLFSSEGKLGKKIQRFVETPNVPVKSEKCSKTSKFNVVKTENKVHSSEKERGKKIKVEGKFKVKQEKV